MNEILLSNSGLRLIYFKFKLSTFILKTFYIKELIDEQKYNSMYDKYAQGLFKLTHEDFNIYNITNFEIKKKNYYSSTSYFDKVCEYLSYTEEIKKKLNKILDVFCNFYEQLQSELTEEKKNFNSEFKIILQFLTFLPRHLEDILNDLGPILKN
ncbi:hypothetical protein COBT_000366 [Conglomerata obtusa]